MKLVCQLVLVLCFTQAALAQDYTGMHIDTQVTRSLDLEAPSSASGMDQSDLSDLYGVYNLANHASYPSRSPRIRARSAGSLGFGLARVALRRSRKSRRRQSSPRPARARFQLSLSESDLASDYDGFEVTVTIRNTGYQELRFTQLERHLFLLDQENLPVAAVRVDSTLSEPVRPGSTVEGVIRFPAAQVGDQVTFAFEDILGRRERVRFR